MAADDALVGGRARAPTAAPHRRRDGKAINDPAKTAVAIAVAVRMSAGLASSWPASPGRRNMRHQGSCRLSQRAFFGMKACLSRGRSVGHSPACCSGQSCAGIGLLFWASEAGRRPNVRTWPDSTVT
jgi:hypothetical protein